MQNTKPTAATRFQVELIKPSHYDDDGYVIQWVKAWIPSNSLATLCGLTRHANATRVLGPAVEIANAVYDETNTVVPVARIIRRIRRNGGHGLVCLVGVQSNQFPRALDLARRFRQGGVQVVIGGFHVSGSLAMLSDLPPDLPPELREAQALGITLFAGEAEEHFADLLRAAYAHRLEPLYNFMSQLPDLQGQTMPYLPPEVARRYAPMPGTFDAGRGCPFLCSFCTIINVQGRKSRFRDPDDIERLLRANLDAGIRHYFITDDNFARNRNWEAIFDRIAAVRRELGVKFNFTIQVDTMCHTLPGFVAKARAAGVSRVFLGLENVNPANLKSANKKQNKIANYRTMLLAWQYQRITTYCGYILGFPDDTPEGILADIETIKRELPLDILEFFCLTPLPGSVDHQTIHAQHGPLDPDLNIYDLEHVCTTHPRMTKAQWQGVYRAAWDSYYSLAHLETLMRRAAAFDRNPKRIMEIALEFYGCFKFERVHPLQGGFLRRKVRTERRPGLPIERPWVFYPRRVREVWTTYSGLIAYAWQVWRLYQRVKKDTERPDYRYFDQAMEPVTGPPEAAGG
ncbi:radical SAM protein [uncultured Thiodictyon sp.]|uniref:B12-binding domain-containing radical SAM protein n=1 Tax=uncultured Thiodictyon sp. TaxID=1846217 RepID=UPI0025CD7230|nr:radical SAM protein [uncultured Thiodictyon sp.]